MQTPGPLTEHDIEHLLMDRSTATQMDVVGKLTAHYTTDGTGGLNPKESGIADDIFKLLLTRAEVQVRAMLAMNLSQSQKLPPDIARQMVADVNDVAAPILEHSTVLTEADLISVINALEDPAKLEAIARRKSVSENVSEALVETRLERVVSTLVQNETAQIADQTFEKIVDRHSDSPEVVESLIQRTAMPVMVVEKVISRISDTLKANLEKKYGNLVELKEMRKALDQSLELTSLKMLGFKSSNEELMRLLDHLDGSNKLSPFSALSMGNMELFEVSLSRLLRIPVKNVQILLQDSEGLRLSYKQAELPPSLFDAASLAIRAIRSLEAESVEKTGMKQMCSPFQVMERMRELSTGQTVEGVDYLYAMMQHCVRRNIRYKTGSAA